MGNNFKTWATVVSVVVGIVISISGYIYAESTSSRSRDSYITECMQREDKEIRSQIHSNQIIQMSMLNDITKNLSIVKNDVEHIKDSNL